MSSGLFQNAKCLEITDYRLCAIDNIDNYLVIGDERGNIYTYELGNESNATMSFTLSIKNRIDQIKCLNVTNPRIALILSNGTLFAFTVPKLEKVTELKLELHRFAMNMTDGYNNQIVTVNKKKVLKFLEYKPELTKFVELKVEELKLGDLPEVLEWYGKWICHSVKKKYTLVSLKGEIVSPGLDMVHCKNVKGAWLVVQKEGIGLFMDGGNPKTQDPILFTRPTVVNLALYKNYGLALYDNSLGVFDTNDSKHIQDIVIEGGFGGRQIISCGKRVFYVTGTINEKSSVFVYQIFELKEEAFQKQIFQYLNELKIEEALTILNNNINSASENKPKLLEKFYLDCSWAYAYKRDYRKAHQYAKLANFNVIEYIYMFSELLKIRIPDEEIRRRVYSAQNPLNNSPQETMIEAYVMLSNLLQDKRNFLIKTNDVSRDHHKKINFERSEISLFDLSKTDFYLFQVLELIHTTLVKVFIKIRMNFRKISELIEYEYFKIDYDDLKSFLDKETGDESKMVMAYIYEKMSKFEEALKIWSEFGNKIETNVSFAKEASERTKSILKKCNDKKLFTENILWMIQKFPEQSFELYLSNEAILPIDSFMALIAKVDNPSDPIIKEKFLEYFISKGGNSERFHTMLAENYTDKLFREIRRDHEYDISLGKEPKVKLVLDKLNKLLISSSYYNPQHILEIIKNSWLVETEIFLYSKLNMHEDALEKLVLISIEEKNFSKAEEYCQQNKKDELYEVLFKIISRNYQENMNIVKSKNETEKFAIEAKNNIYKIQMLNILKRYGENINLDPFSILEEIPGEWLISDDNLYNYITKIMKTYSHTSNKHKVLRNLSEMGLLYKESELFESKNKCISIGIDTICEVCNRKIGSKMISVYPNMKVFHQTCAANPNVCPVTRVDFTKTNYF